MFGGKMAFLTKNTAQFCKRWIITLLFFRENQPSFFCIKLVKIAENCDRVFRKQKLNFFFFGAASARAESNFVCWRHLVAGGGTLELATVARSRERSSEEKSGSDAHLGTNQGKVAGEREREREREMSKEL
jgi:hypothetical protein